MFAIAKSRPPYAAEFRKQMVDLVRSGRAPEGLAREVYRFMSAHQPRFRITTLARVLGVSTSGCYAWRRRRPSTRVQADADLTARVRAVHAHSRGTYGAPRIHAELSAAGAAVSRKQVARVMRAAGIAGVSRGRGRRAGRSGSGRFVDVFSRRVVGWAMAAHLCTALVTEGYRSPSNVSTRRRLRTRTGLARRSHPRASSRPAPRRRPASLPALLRETPGGHDGDGAQAPNLIGSAGIVVARLSAPCPVSPPGAVDLPGLWTPGPQRAASVDRRHGRPQSVGNLADDRWRSSRRRGREIPTGPHRFHRGCTPTENHGMC